MRVHKIFSTLLPALLLPAVAIATEPPATTDGVGECTMLKLIAVGDLVQPGARLLTGKDSHAEIRYKDSCIVPVPVDSLFVYQASSPCQVNGKQDSTGSSTTTADVSVISAVTGEVKMSVCFNPANTGGVAGDAGGGGLLGIGIPATIGVGAAAAVGLGVGLGVTVGSDNGGGGFQPGPGFDPSFDPSRAIP